MTHDNAALYNAYASRDPRFDGVFYIGVTSTGIYCRPVCTAKTPKVANCRFFASAAAAEKAAFRPCLRCRPELAPGNAPVDDAQRIASLLAHRIEEGMLADETGLEAIAAQFGLSARQIRRIVHRELGVSPIELVQTRRLLLAKQLLSETTLPIIEVAYASGFASLRRFNDAFGKRYGMPPSRLRKTANSATETLALETITLQLAYRPPFDWPGMLAFLGARALTGVEQITDDAYRRTARLGSHTGWICVRHAATQRALLVELTHALTPMLPALLGRLRHLFDLGARPDIIAAQLAQDARLSSAVARHPGLRVPGAFEGFELAVRALLGQQLTIERVTTLVERFVAAFGEHIATPHAGLTHLSPPPQRVAAATVEELAALGMTTARARTLIALAQAVALGRLKLEVGASPNDTIAQLVALPGIDAWTANYIAMRALHWPDAFPNDDTILHKTLGNVTAAQTEALSHAWRPWRSYATLHLWRSAAAETDN